MGVKRGDEAMGETVGGREQSEGSKKWGTRGEWGKRWGRRKWSKLVPPPPTVHTILLTFIIVLISFLQALIDF